jgi:hypothetical protein
MNENVYKVLNGFMKLTDAEKSLFIAELNKYQQASIFEKQAIRESVKLKSSVGPKNTICTCCGR